MSDDKLFEIRFVRICVKPYVTEEEVQNLSLRSSCLSRPLSETPIPSIGKLATFGISATIASLGSLLFCLSTKHSPYQPTNEVKMFNPSSPKFKLISCCNMIRARHSPAAISSRGILYVFGGFPPHKKVNKSTPWAEYLNTTLPKTQQRWMPLDMPERHRAHVATFSYPFVIPYNQAGTVFLIGCSWSAILFDTTDMSFKEFNLIHMPPNRLRNPVTVVEDRTMYWIDGKCLQAYDFDNHVHYSALTSNPVLSDFGFELSSYGWGPCLVHLDKNLFCFFTRHCYQDSEVSAPLRKLECTKFRATKVLDNSGNPGHLESGSRACGLPVLSV